MSPNSPYGAKIAPSDNQGSHCSLSPAEWGETPFKESEGDNELTGVEWPSPAPFSYTWFIRGNVKRFAKRIKICNLQSPGENRYKLLSINQLPGNLPVPGHIQNQTGQNVPQRQVRQRLGFYRRTRANSESQLFTPFRFVHCFLPAPALVQAKRGEAERGLRKEEAEAAPVQQEATAPVCGGHGHGVPHSVLGGPLLSSHSPGGQRSGKARRTRGRARALKQGQEEAGRCRESGGESKLGAKATHLGGEGFPSLL